MEIHFQKVLGEKKYGDSRWLNSQLQTSPSTIHFYSKGERIPPYAKEAVRWIMVMQNNWAKNPELKKLFFAIPYNERYNLLDQLRKAMEIQEENTKICDITKFVKL